MPIALAEGTPIPPPPAPGHSTWSTFPLGLDGVRVAPFSHAVPYFKQDQPYWCWAACFQMVRSFKGCAPRGQWALATDVFGPAACAVASSPTCNTGAIPDLCVNRVGLTCTPFARPLGEAELLSLLRQGPVEIGFEGAGPNGPTSHVALVTGVSADGVLRLLDPWEKLGQSSVTFTHLTDGHPAGAWRKTYAQFERL